MSVCSRRVRPGIRKSQPALCSALGLPLVSRLQWILGLNMSVFLFFVVFFDIEDEEVFVAPLNKVLNCVFCMKLYLMYQTGGCLYHQRPLYSCGLLTLITNQKHLNH